VTALRDVNLRSQPLNRSTTVGMARQGDALTVIGQDRFRVWWLILRPNGRFAWVAAQLVSRLEVTEIPVITDFFLVTSREAVIYAEPALEATEVVRVARDSRLPIMQEVSGDHIFYRVVLTDGREGWLHAEDGVLSDAVTESVLTTSGIRLASTPSASGTGTGARRSDDDADDDAD
jgi:uncharacterized protein YgiM (DUF1202 family)